MNSRVVAPLAEADQRTHVSVLVVHDEEVVRAGWRLVLSGQPWAARCLTAGDAEQATMLARRYEPDVAVVDLDLGHDRVAALTSSLRATVCDLQILLLAGHTIVSPKAAQFLGATGVVQRTLPATELAAAVLTVASGHRLYAASAPPVAGALSAREREVLGLMSAGATNREIAQALHLSDETIKQHAAAIYRKLGVRNRTQAAQRGHQLGLTFATASAA